MSRGRVWRAPFAQACKPWIARGLAVSIALTMTACGNGTAFNNDDESVRLIQECIDRGGEPFYTANRYGRVREYLGCGE